MRRAALALACAVLCSSAWAGKAFPPPPPSYVHNEGVISPAAQTALSAQLAGFEQKTRHQFVVALFQSLESESLEDYANKLFRNWKIGDAKRNDGLLLCLFKNERRWRVEVGYGLEGALTDLEAAEIARNEGVPRFKQGDFDGGVAAIARGLEAKLAGHYTPPPAPRRRGNLNSFEIILIFAIWIFLQWLRNHDTVIGRRGGRWSGGFGGGHWGGGGGFSGGGGSSGGGGASGGW